VSRRLRHLLRRQIRFAAPNMRPMTEEERKLCAEIVRRGEGHPFMCRNAVKSGRCACLPCEKLEAEKGKGAGDASIVIPFIQKD